jgi:tight adherence protein C
MDPTNYIVGVLALVSIGSVMMLMVPALSREEVAERRIDAIKNDLRHTRQDIFAQSKRREMQRLQSPLYKTAAMTVTKLKLKRYLTTTDYKQKLIRAGYRNQFSETLFLFGRLALPITFTFVVGTYLFMIEDWGLDPLARMAISLGFGYLGMKLPEIMVKNATDKRQDEIRLAWPDGLDLMLICVESGMSIEESIRKVASEIGIQSMALAEEFMLCLAELSHAPDRAQAYKNLAARIGLDDVKTTTTALIQAEEQGTAVGQALRIMSADIRETRMLLAKKKAAALGPKLTVPMILFFLPVIIFVILWPGVIDVMGWN